MMNNLTRVTTPRNLVVTYRFLGQITRWISSINWKDETMLKNDPEKKAEWEEKVKEYAAENGPDAAGAETATMTEPHPGTLGNPNEPTHSTVTFKDKNGNILVTDDVVNGKAIVLFKQHVLEKGNKKQIFRLPTEKEMEEFKAREASIAAKKVARKEELAKEKAEKEKEKKNKVPLDE